MENRKTPLLAVAIAILAIGIVAAAEPVAAEPEESPEAFCPPVYILLYDPWIEVHEECLGTFP